MAVPAAVSTVEEGVAAHRPSHEPKGQTYPSFAGTWEIVTISDGNEIHGTLVLQQKGKKITGTLTNVNQPPGDFKAKIVVDRAGSTSIKGTCENKVVSSTKKSDVTAKGEDRNPAISGIDYLEGRFAPRDKNGDPADFSGTTVFDNQ